MPSTTALRVELGGDAALVLTDRDPVRAGGVFLVAYAGINEVLLASGLPPLDVEAELAEVCLVEPPRELAGSAVTLMDGPFFSLTPMPAEGAYAFTHVRYTPQARWDLAPGARSPYELAASLERRSRFALMQRDGQRYLPALAGLRHLGSRFEVKAIPRRHAVDDGRPILVRRHSADPLCASVLGSKIDSVFELEEAVEALLGEEARCKGRGRLARGGGTSRSRTRRLAPAPACPLTRGVELDDEAFQRVDGLRVIPGASLVRVQEDLDIAAIIRLPGVPVRVLERLVGDPAPVADRLGEMVLLERAQPRAGTARRVEHLGMPRGEVEHEGVLGRRGDGGEVPAAAQGIGAEQRLDPAHPAAVEATS
jgi:hypothetical protein